MDALNGWTVIVLRATREGTSLRRAIESRGADALFLPALRLAPATDAAMARRALRGALRAPQIIFSSPAAVRFAAALSPLRVTAAQSLFAVGEGTARALARQGLAARFPKPGAMHSEGLLALPDFAASRYANGGEVGLVTAPGGRGLIAAALQARGANVHRADVYLRLPPRFDRRHFTALSVSKAPRALLLSSAEALHGTLAALPAALASVLRESIVVASSVRLVELARTQGFGQAVLAASPAPQTLLATLVQHANDPASAAPGTRRRTATSPG